MYPRDEQGEKHLLTGTYVLLAAEASPHPHASEALDATETPHVAFQVASYDASQPLTIDPVLSSATYLGGRDGDVSRGIAVDQAGQAYVTGNTLTPGSGFPGTAGSLIQSTLGGIYDGFVAKITTNLPFAAFRAKAEIDLRYRPHHDEFKARHGHHEEVFEEHPRRHKDEFEMTAIFTLGPNNNGIALFTEAVMVQVGAFATTIPAGSFKQKKGRFIFEGVIDGVKLEAVLRSLILGNDYEFTIEGKGADLTGTENPVTVSLTIGDDSSSKTITAKIK